NEEVSVTGLSLKDVPELVANNGDKLRLINIWATWCGPCIIEFPDFVVIYRMYRNRDIEFISVSTVKIGKKDKVPDLLQIFEASNLKYIYSGDDTYQIIDVIDHKLQ